jgi:LmbE family N-acetylglucosaminyl deacetylase
VLFTDPLGVSDIGGTLAKHARAGAKVAATVLWDYPKDVMKQIEQMAAILGIEIHVLGRRRGEVSPDLPLKKQIVELIRKVKPDIAITFDPEFAANSMDGDHMATHQLMMDALGLCYRQNFAPEQLERGLETWFVKAVYYPFWGLRGKPDVIVDITDTFDVKVKATLALEGQSRFTGEMLSTLYSEDALKTLLPAYQKLRETPAKLGEEWQRQQRTVVARFLGERVNVAYGEAFKRVDPMKLDYLLL